MRVLRLHGVKDLRLHNEPRPAPTEHETLVRVQAVGICGSDLHWLDEAGIGSDRLETPLVLGHEFAGVIADGPQRGRLVAVDPAINCGQCEFCLEGSPNLCTAMRFAGGVGQDGALREYVAWPTRLLVPLPDSFTAADGAMLEPLGIALYSMDLSGFRVGMTAGVFGCGPIGLLIVQLLRAAGVTQIIATDVLPHRVEAARALGASHALPARNGEETGEILALTAERGVDVAFEVAGENSAVETAIAVAKRGGRVVLVGIPDPDQTSFTASTARRKELTLQLVRRMKHTYPRAVRLVAQGAVDLRSLVTGRFPLKDAVQAFAVAERREGIKVVVEP